MNPNPHDHGRDARMDKLEWILFVAIVGTIVCGVSTVLFFLFF